MSALKGLRGLVVACVVISCTACIIPQRQYSDVPMTDGVLHVTQEDETLSTIARTYNVSVPLLKRVNNISDPNRISSGTRIFVPSATELRAVQSTQVAELKEDGLYHPVGAGETLSAIAKAYEITSRELQEVNNIQNPDMLRAGDQIWVPRAGEVKDVEIPKVTIVSSEPVATPKNDPRVTVEIKATPKPEATPKDQAQEVREFPREVKTFNSIRFQWPIKDTYRVINRYSPPTSVGIDLGAQIGTPVYASADGKVIKIGNVSDPLGDHYGTYLFLYHGEQADKKGIFTIYAHLSEISVQLDQVVKRGELIGKTGNTGQPPVQEGGVLHFSVRIFTDPVDPMKVLP